MYGSQIGRLAIYILKESGSIEEVWVLTGNKGNAWSEGQITISSDERYNVTTSKFFDLKTEFDKAILFDLILIKFSCFYLIKSILNI